MPKDFRQYNGTKGSIIVFDDYNDLLRYKQKRVGVLYLVIRDGTLWTVNPNNMELQKTNHDAFIDTEVIDYRNDGDSLPIPHYHGHPHYHGYPPHYHGHQHYHGYPHYHGHPHYPALEANHRYQHENMSRVEHGGHTHFIENSHDGTLNKYYSLWGINPEEASERRPHTHRSVEGKYITIASYKAREYKKISSLEFDRNMDTTNIATSVIYMNGTYGPLDIGYVEINGIPVSIDRATPNSVIFNNVQEIYQNAVITVFARS